MRTITKARDEAMPLMPLLELSYGLSRRRTTAYGCEVEVDSRTSMTS